MQKTDVVEARKKEAGFTLIEVVIAFLVLTISLLGVLFSITFAINYNTGNSLRSQMQAVAQQQIETLQSAKFNPFITDEILLGGTKPPVTISTADGNKFQVEITVDDDPNINGIQINPLKSLKEITVKVTAVTAATGWQSTPLTIIFRRARGN